MAIMILRTLSHGLISKLLITCVMQWRFKWDSCMILYIQRQPKYMAREVVFATKVYSKGGCILLCISFGCTAIVLVGLIFQLLLFKIREEDDQENWHGIDIAITGSIQPLLLDFRYLCASFEFVRVVEVPRPDVKLAHNLARAAMLSL